ncbi:hypothetical protein GGU10DRAFT_337334, partial [Lentinula aff. detonsa]
MDLSNSSSNTNDQLSKNPAPLSQNPQSFGVDEDDDTDDVVTDPTKGRKRPRSSRDAESSSLPTKVFLATDDPSWKALRDKHHDALRKLTEVKKLNKVLAMENEALKDQKKALQEAVVGAKTESNSLAKTNASLYKSYDTLLTKVESQKVFLTGAQVMRLTTDFGTLEIELQTARKKIQTLELDIQSYKAEIADTADKLQQAENSLFDIQLNQAEELDTMDTRLKQLEGKNEALSKQLTEEVDQLKEAAIKERQDREGELKSAMSLREENAKLKETIRQDLAASTTHQQANELETKGLENEVRNLKEQIDSHATTISKKDLELMRLEKALKVAEKECQDKEEEIQETIRQDLITRATNRQAHEHETEVLEKELRSLREQINSHATTISKKNLDIKHLEGALEAAAKERQDKEEELKVNTNEELTKKDTKVRTLEKDIKDLQSAKTAQATLTQDLANENELLRDHMDGKWVKQSRFDEVQNAQKKDEAKICDLQMQLDEMNLKLSVHQSKLSALRKEKDTLAKDKDELQRQRLALPSTASRSGSSPKDAELAALKLKNENHEQEIKALRMASAGTSAPATSADADASVAEAFVATRKGARKVLSKVNVDIAVQEARRKYQLADSIEDRDQAYTADNESNQSSHGRFLLGFKPKRKRGSQFMIKDKGKGRASSQIGCQTT